MQQRSLRRRQNQRKVLQRRTIRRSLFFMSEQSYQPLWSGKLSAVKKRPMVIGHSTAPVHVKTECGNPLALSTNQKPQTE